MNFKDTGMAKYDLWVIICSSDNKEANNFLISTAYSLSHFGADINLTCTRIQGPYFGNIRRRR